MSFLLGILIFAVLSAIFAIGLYFYLKKFQSPQLNSFLIILIISLVCKWRRWAFYKNSILEILLISIGLWVLFIFIMLLSGYIKKDDIE